MRYAEDEFDRSFSPDCNYSRRRQRRPVTSCLLRGGPNGRAAGTEHRRRAKINRGLMAVCHATCKADDPLMATAEDRLDEQRRGSGVETRRAG